MPRWVVAEGDAAESSSEEEEEEQEDVDDAEDEEQEQDGAAAKSAGRSKIKVSLKQKNSDVCHVSCWPKNVVCMLLETDDCASAHGQHGQSDAQTHSKMFYAVLKERAHAHIAAWLSALTFKSDRVSADRLPARCRSAARVGTQRASSVEVCVPGPHLYTLNTYKLHIYIDIHTC